MPIVAQKSENNPTDGKFELYNAECFPHNGGNRMVFFYRDGDGNETQFSFTEQVERLALDYLADAGLPVLPTEKELGKPAKSKRLTKTYELIVKYTKAHLAGTTVYHNLRVKENKKGYPQPYLA